MARFVYFNGTLLPENEVALPITDRSYLYGEGLFETIHATRGFIPFIEEHLDRFFTSLDLLDFRAPISREKLRFMIYQTLRHNQLKEAYIRVNLSRENESLGSLTPSDRYNLTIFTKDLNESSIVAAGTGGRAVTYPHKTFFTNSLSPLKTTSYLPYLQAKEFAKSKGAFEAILLSPSNHVIEGATSNVFMWDGVQWLTPRTDQGALPGVTRRIILEAFAKNQIPFQEGPIAHETFVNAKEIFVTNSIQEILPITHYESKPVGVGVVGEETQKVEELFREEVQYRFEKHEMQHWRTEE